MAVSTNAARKTLHSGPPSRAPPGKSNPELADDGKQQLSRRRVASAATANPGDIASPVLSPVVSPVVSPSVTPPGACSPSGAASPALGFNPAGGDSPCRSPGSPAPEVADDAEQPAVRVVKQPRSRVFEFCIFLISAAIILIFIALLLFVLAFDNEIITVIDKGSKQKPKLDDLYCNTKLCKSFTREVVSFVNFSRDPCNELLEYLCDGYENEAHFDTFKWSMPGMDYARFTKVLDGIYRRNVSDGPVWDRKFVAEDLWELASPLYERCITGDAAPAVLPYTLTEYLRRIDLNFTADIIEAYKMIPVFHHIFTSAFPWKKENQTAQSMVLGRETSLMPPHFASTRSAVLYMMEIVKDVLRGISPELRIGDGVALALAQAEQLLGQASIRQDFVEPFVSAQVFYTVNNTIKQQIAAFSDYTSLYGDYQGKIRIMYDAVLNLGDAFNTLLQKVRSYNLLRTHMWFHLAARVALATGAEPSATAVLALMGGILGKAHAERRCLTLFDTEARPFAFDRLRAMLHTDEAAARGRELYAKFREYSRMFIRNASFAGSELQAHMIARMDEVQVLFMYPFSNMTDDEVGQYPLTRLVYQLPTPVPVPQNASFWEHLFLIKKEIWDKGMQEVRYAHNLTWMHFSTLELKPRLSMYLRTLYVPAIFYQRIWSMTDPDEKEAIPLDLPIFWWPVLHELSGMFSETLGTMLLTGETGSSLGFHYDRIWSGSQACFLSLLGSLGFSPLDADGYRAPSEPFVVDFLYNLFMYKTESWRLREKPTAEHVFLHDYPDITLDKLFVIALGSNFCRKEDADVKEFQSQRTNTGMSRRQRLIYIMRYWPTFRKIFNCSSSDLYTQEPTVRCITAVGEKPIWS